MKHGSNRNIQPIAATWPLGGNPLAATLLAALCIACCSPLALQANPQETVVTGNSQQSVQQDKPTGKVIGIKYNCVHVLKLEETLKLYTEILGFEKVGEEVLHGKGIEGMVVRKLSAGSCNVYLSLPAPEYSDTVGPIGNTNHNLSLIHI